MEIKKTIPLPSQRDPQEVRSEQLGKLKQASKMYEHQFLSEMVRAMRKTVQRSDLIPETFGERLFRDKLDQEYINSWSDRGGVGLADMIYTQLKEKYFPEKMQKLGPIQGPLPLDSTGQGQVKIRQHTELEQGIKPIEIEIQPAPSSQSGEGAQLTAPWSGKVAHLQRHEDGSKTLVLEHDEGVRSEIRHTGSLKGMDLGQKVEAGENLGEIRGARPLVKWSLYG